MKILICTGIFPPAVGGPAKYAKNLQEEFIKMGIETNVLSYSMEKKLPVFIRHIVYFFRIIPLVKRADLILSLDLLSVGFPSVLAGKIFGKKVILRVGGDFLWETYVEKTDNLIDIENFYKKMPSLPLKHRLIFFLQKFVLSNSSAIVFNTFWQKSLFKKVYNLPQNTFVIENFYGPKIDDEDSEEKIFLFGGRKIKFKNLKILEEVFEEIQRENGENKEIKLEIIDNLLPEDLYEKIKKSYALIVPSVSDFSPNFIIEGLSFNKPFILTKNCGLRDRLKDIGIFIDPFDKEDIKEKILFLLDEKNYREYKDRITNFNFIHSWRQIAEEFLDVYKKISL